jgi:hypothetical protein
MIRWRRALAVGLAVLSACRTAPTDARVEQAPPSSPTAAQVAAVAPEFLPAFNELQRALAAGDDAVASRILRGIQARAPTGAASSLAQAFERVLAGREAVSELRLTLVARRETPANVTPANTTGSKTTPSGNAISNSTDVDSASASTTSTDATTASTAAANPATANAASSSATAQNAASSNAAQPDATPKSTSDGDAALPPRMEARLVLVVENTSALPIELRPGPAALRVTKTTVGRLRMVQVGEPMLGGEQQSSETHPFTELRDLRLDANGSLDIELARFFIDVPDDDVAVRLRFDLELRSGSIVRDGRELPAMNVPVKSCEETRWAALRHPEWKGTPEALAQYVFRAAPISADCALEIAVRIPAADRQRALDEIAGREGELSELHLTELGPALRWLTQDPTLGGDPDLWRVWLRARAATKQKERPRLELPARTSACLELPLRTSAPLDAAGIDLARPRASVAGTRSLEGLEMLARAQ